MIPGTEKQHRPRRAATRTEMRTYRRRRLRRRQTALLAIALVTAAIFVFLLRGFGSSGSEASPDGGRAAVDMTTGNAAAALDGAAGTDSQPVTSAYESLSLPAALPQPARVAKLPTLMFHHVGDTPPDADEIRTGLTVSREEFETMMAYLSQAGYHTVSQRQLFRALFYGDPLPAKPVMLTFDDGYRDNFTLAAPILKQYGLVATFYVVTGDIGNPEYMTWEQVSELDRMGMDVGSHSASHPDLTQLAAADLKHELADSAAAISSHIDHPIYWLSYPAGSYDDDVLRYAKQAGYLLAVTTEPGEQQSSDAPLGLMRYRVRNDTGLEGFKELVR